MPQEDNDTFIIQLLPPEEAAACQAMRHQVYCEELGYEPVTQEGREADEDDCHSDHLLVRRAGDGEAVGCGRVIHPIPGRPLPSLTHARLGPQDAHLEALGLCEFSRFALSPAVRGNPGRKVKHELLSTQLLLAYYAIFLHTPFRHYLALTDERVASLSGWAETPLRPTGDPIQFRGIRQLYLGDRTSLERMSPAIQAVLLETYGRFYPGQPLPATLGRTGT